MKVLRPSVEQREHFLGRNLLVHHFLVVESQQAYYRRYYHPNNATLVIVGAKDIATTPADGEAIQNAIKGAKLVALDAAHISNVEQPKQYTETVLNFLLG